MIAKTLFVAAICCGVFATARAETVSVTFPGSEQAMPDGAGAELVTNNCTGCHSPGMILTQPKLSAATWTAEVQKMQHVYKAPVEDADVPAIVAYLSTLPR